MSAQHTAQMSSAQPDDTNLGAGIHVHDKHNSNIPVQASSESRGNGSVADSTGKWGKRVPYNYNHFARTNQEHADALAAGEQDARGWSSGAIRYEWTAEYGDVGPEFPELEAQLFGGERVTRGLNTAAINDIQIYQEGTVKIDPIVNFENAKLHPLMVKNIKLAKYDKNGPTPIQAFCIPAIVAKNDLIACSQTGSGKTAAYMIPIISNLMGKARRLAAPRPNPDKFRAGIDKPVRVEPLVVIVCPSRELATQIFHEACRICYRSMLRPCLVYGGAPKREQQLELQKGCDVLVATPGRLCDFMNDTNVLALNRVRNIVFDEADEMLNSSWGAELQTIMTGANQQSANLTFTMFSATFPKMTRDLAKEHLAHDHCRIRAGRAGSSHANIEQRIIYVKDELKKQALLDMLTGMTPTRVMVFVNSRRACEEWDDFFYNVGQMPCTSIHGDRTQVEREDSLRAFTDGVCPIMICTSVMARGLDIQGVMMVVIAELPTMDHGGIEEYTHRIGRTGRMGNKGVAISFYNERDVDMAPVLVKTLLETKQIIPDFMEQYLPEDINNLEFEADSDYGDDNDPKTAGESWVRDPNGGPHSTWKLVPDNASSNALAIATGAQIPDVSGLVMNTKPADASTISANTKSELAPGDAANTKSEIASSVATSDKSLNILGAAANTKSTDVLRDAASTKFLNAWNAVPAAKTTTESSAAPIARKAATVDTLWEAKPTGDSGAGWRTPTAPVTNPTTAIVAADGNFVTGVTKSEPADLLNLLSTDNRIKPSESKTIMNIGLPLTPTPMIGLEKTLTQRSLSNDKPTATQQDLSGGLLSMDDIIRLGESDPAKATEMFQQWIAAKNTNETQRQQNLQPAKTSSAAQAVQPFVPGGSLSTVESYPQRITPEIKPEQPWTFSKENIPFKQEVSADQHTSQKLAVTDPKPADPKFADSKPAESKPADLEPAENITWGPPAGEDFVWEEYSNSNKEWWT